MLRKGLLTIALASAALVAPASAHAVCPNAGVTPPQLDPAAASSAVVCLMNERRRAAGVRLLHPDARLQRAAAGHSNAMNAWNFFAHDSAQDGSPLARIRATGFFSGASSWGFAENIHWGAGGLASPRKAVSRWMASPPHRASMLSGRFKQVGVGVALGSPQPGVTKAAIYTANFGYRK